MTIGIVGLVVIVALIYTAFNAQNLPVVGGGTTYRAQFSEAGGLKTEDEVRVAGVKVGTVTGVDLVADHVTVSFRIKGAWIGDKSTAAIRIKTLLGQKYLAIVPSGARKLSARQEIPLSRTTSPYDVVDAISQLSVESSEINTKQLATALNTLSSTFANTPKDLRQTVSGLSKLSKTISSRDGALRELLRQTRQVSGTLAARSGQLTKLISDGNLLLTEITKRRVVIHALLQSTITLSKQISGLVTDNQKDLKPALTQLSGVVKVLQKNQTNLDQSLKLLGPFVTVFADTLGNGRWFDTYLQNLIVPGPVDLGSVTGGLCPTLGQVTGGLDNVTNGLGGTVSDLGSGLTGSLNSVCKDVSGSLSASPTPTPTKSGGGR
ncbi:MAG TPA: MCE family protein [Mycobacteriales bacterium]|jgi:phospholipid/cholesterol/gamma-HCH transport system substrate-binding protein|nr:MCE family protein [Mycobacteriales bacterium]